MCVSRAWYDTVLRTHELWGGILPSLLQPRHWLTACDRAGEAAKCLLYGERSTWHCNDTQLRTARSIHTMDLCPWRNFGRRLQGLNMRLLEVLCVCPHEGNIPDSLPATPRAPTYAPRLLICEISSPAVFITERSQHLVVSNFWVEQLRAALSALVSLKHLEIHRTRSSGRRVDWTALIASTGRDFLETLIFWCPATQSRGLSTNVEALKAPRLRVLDAGGAVLVRSPCMQRMHVEHVAWHDLVMMLAASPSIESLTVRSLVDGDLSVEGGVGLPQWIELPLLEAVDISSVLAGHTRGVFELLRATAICDIVLHFDATAPPNREALGYVIELLTAAVSMGAAELERVFQWARRAFQRSGYYRLLFDLSDVLGGVGVLENAEVNVGALRGAALVLRDVVRAAADDAEMLAGREELLGAAVNAAMQAAGVDLTHASILLARRA
ncbi:unnamed protein product [Peniophora sp. CBMAI 1063]|nr:unnamed protein product [Peniophora sp. CBMAI 1063]